MRSAHPLARPLISFTTRNFHSHLANPLLLPSLQQHPRLQTLTLAPPLFSMADTNNISSVDSVSAEDAKFGFTRPEMFTANLAGTVDPYDRHVFLCFKNPDAWLSRVEASETDLLPKLFSSALKSRKSLITVKTKFTICEGREGTEFEDGDVLIFPEMIKYKGLKESDVEGFVDDVLVNGKPWASGVQETLTGSHIFVCAHGSRDKRCGVCGPVLIDKLQEEIAAREFKNQVFVSGCSHVGGHKYAGNLIIYSPDSEGKIMGHWYGYVSPKDVPEILDQHIAKGEVIERIWRGQMGAYVEENPKEAEQTLPNGKDTKQNEKHEEAKTEVSKDAGGCCQGVNGFSCCRDGSTAEKPLKETVEVLEKNQQAKRSGLGAFEQSDVLAAVAVVGAVATVAVAYSLYKRSG